jgi:hypothetical protein
MPTDEQRGRGEFVDAADQFALWSGLPTQDDVDDETGGVVKDIARELEGQLEGKGELLRIVQLGESDLLMCCISGFQLVDPVMAEDGILYERSGIVGWFLQGKYTSPRTRAQIGHRLFSDVVLRAALVSVQLAEFPCPVSAGLQCGVAAICRAVPAHTGQALQLVLESSMRSSSLTSRWYMPIKWRRTATCSPTRTSPRT